MQPALSAIYPVTVGQREFLLFTATGPKSYDATNLDAVSLPYGIYLDFIEECTTVSGTYCAQWKPSATGNRPSWKAIWIVVATGIPVGNGVDLSGESIQFGAWGGSF